jgi:hypothetical protein
LRECNPWERRAGKGNRGGAGQSLAESATCEIFHGSRTLSGKDAQAESILTAAPKLP